MKRESSKALTDNLNVMIFCCTWQSLRGALRERSTQCLREDGADATASVRRRSI